MSLEVVVLQFIMGCKYMTLENITYFVGYGPAHHWWYGGRISDYGSMPLPTTE